MTLAGQGGHMTLAGQGGQMALAGQGGANGTGWLGGFNLIGSNPIMQQHLSQRDDSFKNSTQAPSKMQFLQA